MVQCNFPPCLRNRLFSKSFHSALGVLGLTDLVPVFLDEFDARNGWILESRVGGQGGAEVIPLLVQPLVSRILSSARLHSFLRSVYITQESSSGGGGGSSTNCAAVGMRQTCGREMRCQKI